MSRQRSTGVVRADVLWPHGRVRHHVGPAPSTVRGVSADGTDRITTAIAAQVRAERGARNISCDELADRSGLDRPTMARIERAEREIAMPELYRMCGVLDIEPRHLLQAAQDALRT